MRSSELPATKRNKFLAHKKVLVLYLNTDTRLGEIVRKPGVSRSELDRITERALSARADGEPVGFLACLPGYRLKSYTRPSPSPSPKQLAGHVSQFLNRSLREQHFVVNTRVVHGNESGRLALTNGEKLPATTTIPYDRVQLDGHRIDAIFTVTLTDPQGNEQCLPLCRPWLLVLIDSASRAVLGYHLSLSENYTAEDVLTCLGSALEPWIEKPLPDSLVGYLPGAGLPSGAVEGCAWRIFNTIVNGQRVLSPLSVGSVPGAAVWCQGGGYQPTTIAAFRCNC